MSLQDIFLGKSRWSNIKIRIRSNQTRALFFREYQKGIQGLVTQRRHWMKSEILCVNLKESPWIHCIYLLMFGPLKWGSDNWHLDRTYMCYPASSCKLSKLIRFTFIHFISPFAVISMLHCNSNGILFWRQLLKATSRRLHTARSSSVWFCCHQVETARINKSKLRARWKKRTLLIQLNLFT